MKTPHPLLDDVLGEDLQGELLDTTLREVRRHRARRRRRFTLGATVALLAASAFLWRIWIQSDSSPLQPAYVAMSETMPALVTTVTMMETRPGSLEWITSDVAGVTIVKTPETTAQAMEINDNELFSLLEGRPAAIVRPKNGPAEFLLLTSSYQPHARNE